MSKLGVLLRRLETNREINVSLSRDEVVMLIGYIACLEKVELAAYEDDETLESALSAVHTFRGKQ